jgi:hypothetical protein
MEITTKLIENNWEFEKPLHEEEKSDCTAVTCVGDAFFLHKEVEVSAFVRYASCSVCYCYLIRLSVTILVWFMYTNSP